MKIAIGGNVCPSYCNQFFENASAEEIFGDVKDAVADCERFIVNLECALTDRGTPISKKGPNLRATPKAAKILKEIGVTDAARSTRFPTECLKTSRRNFHLARGHARI